jgi:mono/diheme cytochrome c family protein
LSIVIAIFLAGPPTVAAQNDTTERSIVSVTDLTRGRTLYETACDACHAQNIHWRDKSLVSSWTTLLKEVTRWQVNAGQRWEQPDINNVAAYLNDRFYHLPCPANECADKKAAAGLTIAGH